MAKKKANKLEHKEIDVKEVKAGMLVRVHQLIKDVNAKGEEKERVQVFEGLVLSRKHGNELGATFTVRKISEGVGVEKMYPLHSPLIEKVELVDIKQTNQSKLYYTRDHKKRLKSVSEKKITIAKAETPKQKNEGKKVKIETPTQDQKEGQVAEKTKA